MRKIAIVGGATVVLGSVLFVAFRAFGPSSVAWSFVVVWAPMTWSGVVSRVVPPRLPRRLHELRPFELDGRTYELLGVRAAKQVLRRGPLAAFNPHLHLPAERSPDALAELDRAMRTAEASHAIWFVVTLAVAGHAALRGWWAAAAATVAFDVVLNGYPAMLQRYNRALLQRRFGVAATEGPRSA